MGVNYPQMYEEKNEGNPVGSMTNMPLERGSYPPQFVQFPPAPSTVNFHHPNHMNPALLPNMNANLVQNDRKQDCENSQVSQIGAPLGTTVLLPNPIKSVPQTFQSSNNLNPASGNNSNKNI